MDNNENCICNLVTARLLCVWWFLHDDDMTRRVDIDGKVTDLKTCWSVNLPWKCSQNDHLDTLDLVDRVVSVAQNREVFAPKYNTLASLDGYGNVEGKYGEKLKLCLFSETPISFSVDLAVGSDLLCSTTSRRPLKDNAFGFCSEWTPPPC